jgi:hypothetical protein
MCLYMVQRLYLYLNQIQLNSRSILKTKGSVTFNKQSTLQHNTRSISRTSSSVDTANNQMLTTHSCIEYI